MSNKFSDAVTRIIIAAMSTEEMDDWIEPIAERIRVKIEQTDSEVIARYIGSAIVDDTPATWSRRDLAMYLRGRHFAEQRLWHEFRSLFKIPVAQLSEEDLRQLPPRVGRKG